MNGKQFATDIKSIKEYENYNKHMAKISATKLKEDWEHYRKDKLEKKPKWTIEDQRIEEELWDS